MASPLPQIQRLVENGCVDAVWGLQRGCQSLAVIMPGVIDFFPRDPGSEDSCCDYTMGEWQRASWLKQKRLPTAPYLSASP
jgi:hypothetical protein